MKNKELFPLLLGFVVMGFVDIVGVATSYIKVDYHLSNTIANLLPMMVFAWFAIISIPTGILMNKFGKRNVVMSSLLFTIIALALMYISNFAITFLAFALIGIGNTILQVSLNPMVAETVEEKRVLSTLTLGQFFKSISSFLGPILVGLAASWLGNWQLVFVLYLIITVICLIWIHYTIPNKVSKHDVTNGKQTFMLLANKRILLLFIGIISIVGIDVGLNTTIPQYLMDRCDISLNTAALGTSLYFAAKITGTFVGAILLAKISGKEMLKYTMIGSIAAFLGLFFIHNIIILLILIFLIGLACSNVFSIIYSNAIGINPEKNNEISALMIMAVSGGAIIPPIMGIVEDFTSPSISMSVLLAGIVYLLYLSFRLNNRRTS